MIVKEIYKSLVKSAEAINYILSETGSDVSEELLISVSDENSATDSTPDAVFTVNILWPDKDGCALIATALTDFLLSKHIYLSDIYGSHSIVQVSGDVSSFSDSTLKTSQISYTNAVENACYSLASMRNAFTPEQAELYIDMLGKCEWDSSEERENASGLLKELTTAREDAFKEAQFKDAEAAYWAEAAEIEAEKTAFETDKAAKLETLTAELSALEEKMTATVPGPVSPIRRGIKNAVIGLFLGAFLAAGAWAMAFIFKNRVDWNDEFEYSYGMGLLCKIPPETPAKEFIVDKWIRRWKYHDIKASKEEALRFGAAQIAMLMQKDSLKKPALISAADEFAGHDDMLRLRDTVAGITEEPLVIEDILGDSSNIEQLAEADSVVVLTGAGVTHRRDLYKLIDLLKRQDKKVLGGIMVPAAATTVK